MSRRTERISERTWAPLAASAPPTRWTPMRKAMVVRAILAGNLAGMAARLRFDLAEEELSGWISRYVKHGVKGLRTTRLQNYRTRTAGQYRAPAQTAEKISGGQARRRRRAAIGSQLTASGAARQVANGKIKA